ncbi:MAG: TIGR04086 family membrane protein [Candidatus Ventricola sp.]
MENRTTQSFPRRERGLDSFKRTMRRSARRARGGGALSAVMRGVLVAAAVTVLGVVLFALLLNWWDASDRAITAINQVVKFVSILAGVTSALRAGEKGSAMRGACVGVLYMALGIACYCLLMGQSPKLTGYLADLGMGLAAGGLFGMILTARKSA